MRFNYRAIKFGAFLPSVIALGVLLVVWQVAVVIFDVPDWLLPTPIAVFGALFSELPTLVSNAGVTLLEVAIGLTIAVAVSVALATFMALTGWGERLVFPVLIVLQTLPILAIAPLLIVWFGVGLAPKIIIVFLISFFPIVVNLTEGFKSVDRDLTKLFRVLGASRLQTFTKLQWPHALSYLFIGLKLGVVGAVVGAVVGEWIGSDAGLGHLIRTKGPQFQTEIVFAAIIVLTLISGLLFLGVKLIGGWVLRNYD